MRRVGGGPANVGRAGAAAVLLVLGMLTGCGRWSTGAEQAAVTPTPGGARPCEYGESPKADACFDADVAMRSNRRFQERNAMSPEDEAAARAALPKLKAVLDAQRRKRAVSPELVGRALKRAGFLPRSLTVYATGPDHYTKGVPMGATAVSVLYGGTCVFGWVNTAATELEVGGITDEGSCHPGNPGH